MRIVALVVAVVLLAGLVSRGPTRDTSGQVIRPGGMHLESRGV